MGATQKQINQIPHDGNSGGAVLREVGDLEKLPQPRPGEPGEPSRR